MDGSLRFYCINLKHRQDRWKRFSEYPEVQKIMKDYPFERFNAVNGSAIDLEKDTRVSLRTQRNIREHVRRDHEELNSAGGIGCYLSHVEIWKKFLETGEDYAIVFEDDAIVENGFVEKLRTCMKDVTLLPKKPDYWHFAEPGWWAYDAKGMPRPEYNKDKNVGPWLLNTYSCTTGYLVTKRGAQILLDHAFPIDMQVDSYIWMCSYLGYILSVFHRDINMQQYNIDSKDTDIQVFKDCPVCDLPTNFPEKGIITVNMPVAAVGAAVIGILVWVNYMAAGKRGGRR